MGAAGGWLHGHDGGTAGVAYYGTAMTSWNHSAAVNTDWLIMCGQNAMQNNLIIANGVSLATAHGGSGNQQLALNSEVGHQGKWVVHSIMVWSRHLSRAEIGSLLSLHASRLSNSSGDDSSVRETMASLVFVSGVSAALFWL